MPGPRGLPLVGSVPQLMADPFDHLRELQRQHGDIFRVPLPAWDLVIVGHPDLVSEVMLDRGERFGRPGLPAWIERRTGTPFNFLDGDDYVERRRIITPMFGKRFLGGLADPVVDEFSSRLERWEQFADTGEVVDLDHELARLTLPAFMRAMFSMSITEEEFLRYDRDLRALLLVGSALPFFMRSPLDMLPLPGRSNAVGSFLRMEREVSRFIEERKRSPEPHADLLQVFVDGRLADGSALPPKDVVHDATGTLLAGYDTVVQAMCWMLALLPTNPEAQARLYAEVDTLEGATPTAADVDRMTWTRACFDEAQRLQGHPFFPKWAKVDTRLAGYDIPKGTTVGGSFTLLHRDPRWWANPDVFDPTHFTDADQVKARPKAAFIPFGIGQHQCVGIAMAYMNATFLTSLILQRYRIELPDGWEPRHDMVSSVGIKGGLPATVHRR